MSSDVEYLLLKEKGPFHDVCVRRRLNTSTGTCKFYAVVISILVVCMVSLLVSLVYVFVLVPSWQGTVLSWDGRLAVDREEHAYPEAHTLCGPVRGVVEKGVHVFRGIPYARPPAGERRWKEPLHMSHSAGTCWSGTFPATRFGSPCPHPAGSLNYSDIVGHEDCLYLNIWSPTLDPLANLPVMVWIHGGFLVHLSGNTPGYSPTPELATSTNAVYISFNYRLGPLGFLSLDLLSKASGTWRSGNYGLLDQLLALRWVRDNIRNFGGNPNKVTVFGQSSGGSSISALLASPLAAGLFHRAWVSSPLPFLPKDMQSASKDNLVLLNKTGCADVECLMSLSVSDLIRASPWTVFPYWNPDDLFDLPKPGPIAGLTPVIDGYILTASPLDTWHQGRGNSIPTLFTTTAQEADLMPFDLDIRNWTWSRYESVVRKRLAPFGEDVADTALELYPPEDQLTPEYQYTSMVSDIHFTCPTDTMADAAAALSHAPVYRAVVTSFPSHPITALHPLWRPSYAFHSWDLLAFFGDFAALGFTPEKLDLDFQRVLRQQVMTVARDGQPEAPVWQPFHSCTALLSDHVFPVDHFNRDRCSYWLKKGVLPHSGGN